MFYFIFSMSYNIKFNMTLLLSLRYAHVPITATKNSAERLFTRYAEQYAGSPPCLP